MRSGHEPDCLDVALPQPQSLDEALQPALEDYARVLLEAREANVMPAAGRLVTGLHVCGPLRSPSEELLADLDGFARSLSAPAESARLGWS